MGAALVTFFGVVGLAAVADDRRDRPRRVQRLVRRDRGPGAPLGLRPVARGGGAGPRRPAPADFWRVTLPLILPGVVSGALLVFTVSIDDYVITSFVAGVGATTLPLQIYSMLKVGVTPEVNAVSTLLLAVTVVLILSRSGSSSRRRRGRSREAEAGGRGFSRSSPAAGLAGCERGRGAARSGARREKAQCLHLVRVPAPGGHRGVRAADRDRRPLRPLRLERARPGEAPVRRRGLRPRRAVGLHGADPRPPEAPEAAGQVPAQEPRKPRPPVPRQGVRSGQRLLAAVPLGDDRLRLQQAEGGAGARQLGAAVRPGQQGPDPDARRHAGVFRASRSSSWATP